MKLVILVSALIISAISAHSQFIPATHLIDSAKTGIYVTAEQFRSNQPEVICNTFGNEVVLHTNGPGMICSPKISYFDANDAPAMFPTEDIWAIVYNGHVYIHHEVNESVLATKHCLFRLLHAGMLSSFMYIRNTSGGTYSDPGNPGRMSIPYEGKTKIFEYVVDMTTGNIYDVATDFNKIKQVIAADPAFGSERVTKKNLDDLIIRYNDAHPHPLLKN